MRTRLTLLLAFGLLAPLVPLGCGPAAEKGRSSTDSGDPKTKVDPEPNPGGAIDNPDGPNPGGHVDNPDGPHPFPPFETDDVPWPNQRNGDLKHGVADTVLPANLELLWSREIPFGVPATCAIAGGRVYVPTLEGYLYCLDRATGDVVWKYRSEPDESKFAPGFSAAPTVTDETIFTGDEDGYVHAIDRAEGTKKWTFDTRGEVAGGPTVIGENGESLLVTSHGGGMYRLKTSDGTIEWTIGEIGPINLSPPLVDGRTFALGCETGALVTVDVETGKEISRMPLGTAEMDGTTLGTPAVSAEDGRLYLGMYDGRVVSIDYAAGEYDWTFRPKRTLEFHASCAITEDAVYAVGRNKLLHRLDRATGDEVWSFAALAQCNAAPVVCGDRVFFGSDDEHVYGVSTETGEKVFSHNLESAPPAGPAIGEGVLVIGTEGNPGGAFCFGAKPE